MKIGIIVYSQTGNTYTVAERIKDALVKANHQVGIEQIQTEGQPGSRNFQIKSLPDTNRYEALIFGSPVQAFSLAAVMNNYLQQLAPLAGKRVACFVTKGLPFNWTGGNRAVNQMKDLCGNKEASICGTGIIKWTKSSRERDTAELVSYISGLF